MTTVEITKPIAQKVLEIVDAGLSHGMGTPEPGQMCVEAAVCYAMGLPHGDDPPCVAPSLRSLKIRLNDSSWSSKASRAKGLRRLAVAQLGSRDALDEVEFAKRVARLAIQTQVPAALRAAARLFTGARADRLLTEASLCERDPTIDNAKSAQAAANAAYAAYAAYAADAAVNAAAYAAYAANAAYAAVNAAAYAADAAVNAAAYAAYAAADADQQLAAFAEGVVQILIDMNAPGVQWLYLTEE